MFHTYVMLIQTVYRALLTSAVSGIGHRIHTPNKKTSYQSTKPGTGLPDCYQSSYQFEKLSHQSGHKSTELVTASLLILDAGQMEPARPA